MELKTILLCIMVAVVILVVLYNMDFFKNPVNTFVNPVLTARNNKIWTYLEKDYTGTDRISLPYNNHKRDIPVFYKKCVELMKKYNVIVVTPENIHQYLSVEELPFNNNPDSQLSFKTRSDIIAASLLYKHGGLFLERGTVLMKDPTPLLQKLEIYDLITFGLARDPPGPSCCSVENMPNNQVLASRPGNPMLPLYKQKLLGYCQSGVVKGGNFDNHGTVALSESLKHIKETSQGTPNIPKRPFNHFNFGANFDGTRDHHNNYVDFNLLLGKGDIEYASPNQIYFISTPTEHLYNSASYSWFLNLSEEQLKNSDIYVAKVLASNLSQ